LFDKVEAVEARIVSERRQQTLQFAKSEAEALGETMDRLAVFLRQQTEERQGLVFAHETSAGRAVFDPPSL
jgi:hypothetical protein